MPTFTVSRRGEADPDEWTAQPSFDGSRRNIAKETDETDEQQFPNGHSVSKISYTKTAFEADIQIPINALTTIDSSDSDDDAQPAAPESGFPHSSFDPELSAQLDNDSTNSDEDETERKLSADTYSFFAFSCHRKSMFLAIVLACMQMMIYLLIASDVVSSSQEEGKNALGIPYNVRWQVRMTGFIAIIIAVYTQEDVRISMGLWRDGYDEDFLSRKFKGSTRFKFITSTTLRFVQGVLSLLTSLFLILQSDTVLDVLLNFTAIEVVSFLDDVAFILARAKYFGAFVKKDTDTILQTSYNLPNGTRKRFRAISLSVILGIMLILWGVGLSNEALEIPTLGCDSGQVLFRLELRTDSFPEETIFELRDLSQTNSERTLLTGGPFAVANNDFVQQFCVQKSGLFRFEIKDSIGDGLSFANEKGGYRVILGGVTILSDSSLGKLASFVRLNFYGNGTVPETGIDSDFCFICGENSTELFPDGVINDYDYYSNSTGYIFFDDDTFNNDSTTCSDIQEILSFDGDTAECNRGRLELANQCC